MVSLLKSLAVHGVAGLLFGVGLVVAGMSNPAKVLNFLDIAGTWDPSLAFVMGGALAVATPGFRLVLRRPRPFWAPAFRLPKSESVEPRLLFGAGLFGIGWGLVGLCPGPAVTAIQPGGPAALLFLAAMVLGIALGRVSPRRLARPVDEAA